jgi:predicted AlkP superfamily phosphohydrolase/phosphomutase
VYDDAADPAQGFDSVLVRQGTKVRAASPAQAVLKPAAARDDTSAYSPRFRVTKGGLAGFTYFRLWALGADGTMALYQRGVNTVRGSESDEELDAYMSAYGGFHDDVFWDYADGAFGTPIGSGGDGTAERRLIETVRFDVELRTRGVRYALAHWRPDLLFHYTPTTDSAGHTWVGALDPDGPRYDPALAAKLWPYYEAVFALEDSWLGAIMDASGPGAAIFLVSDHGMAAQTKTFYPNAVLERAGLLEFGGPKGRDLQLPKTKACVPPYSDFFVVVNGTDRKGGIVPPAEREAVLAAATDALLATTDPETGARVVTAVLRASDIAGLGVGGPASGDLYLELAPGYYPDDRSSKTPVQAVTSPIGHGAHGFLPLRRSMQTICVIGGAGIVAGATLPPVRQIDVAPTVARLLGIPAPRDARGHVLGEILR